MTVNIDDLALAVGDVYTDDVPEGDRMNRAIAAAVRYYARWHPLCIADTLDITVGETTYELPDDFERMLIVDYFPSGVPAWFNVATEELLTNTRSIARVEYGGRVLDDVALDLIRTIYRSHRLAAGRGGWTVRSKELILSPASIVDQTLNFVYAATYTLEESGLAYEDIPSEDFDILRDLTVAELLERQINNVVTEWDYIEGLEKVRKAHLPDVLYKRISTLRRSVSVKYGGFVCAMS